MSTNQTEAPTGKKRFTPKKNAAAAPGEAAPKAEKPAKAPKAPKEPKPPKEVKPLKTVDENLAALKKDNPELWKRVERVTEASDKNRPLRVLVKCTDPQTDREGNKICGGTREIAVQDLFQTKRCQPCQKRYLQTYRNARAKTTRSARKQAEPAVAKA